MMMEEAIQYHYAETSSRIQDNSIWCLTVISEDQCLSIMMRRCFCSWRREEKRRRGEEEASEFWKLDKSFSIIYLVWNREKRLYYLCQKLSYTLALYSLERLQTLLGCSLVMLTRILQTACLFNLLSLHMLSLDICTALLEDVVLHVFAAAKLWVTQTVNLGMRWHDMRIERCICYLSPPSSLSEGGFFIRLHFYGVIAFSYIVFSWLTMEGDLWQTNHFLRGWCHALVLVLWRLKIKWKMWQRVILLHKTGRVILFFPGSLISLCNLFQVRDSGEESDGKESLLSRFRRF